MNKLFSAIFTVAISCAFASNAQIINTIAGNGTSGMAGDGGPATAAQLSQPDGVYLSPSGDKFICDAGAHSIRKISTTGIITTIAGNGTAGFSGDGGPATAALLNRPFDITEDASGNLYFTDNINYCVRKIDVAGVITTIAGNGVNAYTGDGGPATAASLSKTAGIVLDGAGNIYIGDQFNHVIRKVNTAGIITTIAGTGTAAFSGDGGPATAAALSYPNYLIFNSAGELIITDNGNHRVRKLNLSSGIISTIVGNGVPTFGGDGGPATSASLRYPGGVAYDGAGNMYIADNVNSRIRKVTPGGIISTVVGNGIAGYSGDGGPATAAQINTTVDIAISSSGDYFFADLANHRVRGVPASLVNVNNPPIFTDTSHMLMACENTEMITVPSLEASDIDTGQTETYSLLMAPSHGAVYGLPFSTTSTGGVFSPAMISYTPAAMYYGADSFSVGVSDGVLTDTQLFHVTVLPNNPGTIAGADTLCIGDTATMSNYIDGGIWTTGALSLSTISASGFFTAIAAGTDTVFYNLPNLCNAGITSHIVTILSAEACAKLDVTDQLSIEKISVYPNPNHGVFTIKGLNVVTGGRTATITDLAGRKVAEYLLGSSREVRITTELSKGMYLVVIAEGDSRKVLKMVVTD